MSEETSVANGEAPNPVAEHRGGSRTADRVALGLTVVLAAVVRLMFVSQSNGVPFVQGLVGDAEGYMAWAGRIAQGEWIGSEPFYQAPLYPYVLAVLSSLGLDKVGWVRVTQALWGAAAAGLIVVAARNWFGRWVGLFSGLIFALYAPAVFYDGLIQKASLAGLLTCGLLAIISGIGGTSRQLRYFLLGLLAALLALTRENALIWIPLLILSFVISSRSGPVSLRIKRSASLLLGVLVILGPVAALNLSRGGGFALTTTQFGTNFYIGNHAGADGLYHPLVRGHETPAFEQGDATHLAEEAMGRSLSAGEVSDYWRTRTWHDIRQEPGSWIALMGRKLLMVLNDYEVTDAEGMVVYADASEILRTLKTIGRFGVLFPLAVVGAFLCRDSWRELWIVGAMFVAMAGAVAMFFVLGRYRVPLVPLLIPFAAVGCFRLWESVRRRRWRDVVGAVLLGSAAIVVSHWPVHDAQRLDAMARMNAGVALAQRGALTGALGYFERAVEGFPNSPEANANLAQALAQVGEATGEMRFFERAVEHYVRAAGSDVTLPGVYFNLGVALERLGRTGAAIKAFERALAEAPDDQEARRALERLHG